MTEKLSGTGKGGQNMSDDTRNGDKPSGSDVSAAEGARGETPSAADSKTGGESSSSAGKGNGVPSSGTAEGGDGKPQEPKVRSLRAERKEGRRCLDDVRTEVKLHGGRLSTEVLSNLEAACGKLSKAIDGKVPRDIVLAREEVEALAEKHLKFQRGGGAGDYFVAIFEALLIALAIRFFLVEPYKIPSGSMIPTLLIGDHIFVNKLSYGVRIPLAGKMVAHWGGYERGDVVVFVNPLDDQLPALRQRDYVKRIIGLPGDTVEVIGEVVHVNGVPQARTPVEDGFSYYDRMVDNGEWTKRSASLLDETLATTGDLTEKGPRTTHSVLSHPDHPHAWREGPFVVPAGHLFMMGDNRDNSQDGRYGKEGGWFVPFDHVKGRAFVIWFSWGVPGFGLGGDLGVRFDRLFHGL